MLPCIIIDLFLNNQKDALIIQIYSVIKLYMFREILSAHHQEFSTVLSALIRFMQVFLMTASKQLGSGHQNLHETYQCGMYSRKLLMMGREDARNM